MHKVRHGVIVYWIPGIPAGVIVRPCRLTEPHTATWMSDEMRDIVGLWSAIKHIDVRRYACGATEGLIGEVPL